MLDPMGEETVKRVNVLGVGISPLNLERAVAQVRDALENRRKGYICVTGVHGVMEAQDAPEFRTILNGAFLCTPDGMPMVWMGRQQGVSWMGRVYGPDLMLEVCEMTARSGYRHFFYGGADGVAEQLRDRLVARFPGLQVVGTYTPPFRPLNPEEEAALIHQVAECRPDIIWVGLSTPKQERFMSTWLDRLDTTLMFGVGAAFDFHIGRVRQAPRWMQRSGLEWFFRLCTEPRRLWRRYFRNNPRFLFRACLQIAGLKRYSLD